MLKSLKSIFLTIITSSLIACGGGTSGTSDPDTAFIRGVVQSVENESFIANAEMYLIDKKGVSPKVKSETDTNGQFLMIGEGSDFEIEILNTDLPKLELNRSFRGYSSIGMSININTKEQTVESSNIEAKFSINSDCKNIFNNQGELTQIVNGNLELCSLEISSSFNNKVNEQGNVSYFCSDNQDDSGNTIKINYNGKVSIPFKSLLELKCKNIQVAVNNSTNSAYPATTLIELL